MTFLLSGNSAVQADKIGSFANVRNYIVRVLTSRMTNSEVLSYTSRKEEHFKKILKFCYYCRTQLLNFPKVELRWAITDVIKNDISSTWYDALITMRTDDPMIQYEHKMFVNVNSFDEVLYNFGIMYLVYKELTEQLEEGYPLCEDPKCFGRAINLGMIDQEASDERVRRLLRGLVCYFECMKDCQRSKFKGPLCPGGISPSEKQARSTTFAPIFVDMPHEETSESCMLKRSASEPCSVKEREEAGEKQLKKDEKQLDDGMCVKQITPSESPSPLLRIFGTEQLDDGMRVEQIIPIIPSESPSPLLRIFGIEHCEEKSVEHCEEESVVQLGEDVDPLNGMYDAEDCDEESVVQLEEMGTDTTHDIPTRAKSAPCAANSFERRGQEKEEGNVRGIPVCPQSGLPNSDYFGGDSINAFMAVLSRMDPPHLRTIPNSDYPGGNSTSDSRELKRRMKKGKWQPSGRSATAHDGQTYSQSSGDFTKPLVFGIPPKKDDK